MEWSPMLIQRWFCIICLLGIGLVNTIILNALKYTYRKFPLLRRLMVQPKSGLISGMVLITEDRIIRIRNRPLWQSHLCLSLFYYCTKFRDRWCWSVWLGWAPRFVIWCWTVRHVLLELFLVKLCMWFLAVRFCSKETRQYATQNSLTMSVSLPWSFCSHDKSKLPPGLTYLYHSSTIRFPVSSVLIINR